MGNAVTNPGRFIEKKVFGVNERNQSMFVPHNSSSLSPQVFYVADPAQTKILE
jgi:hypothetical protein